MDERKHSHYWMMLAAIILLADAHHTVHAQDDPPRGEVRIVVISDMNSSYGSTSYEPSVDSTIARILRVWRPELVLAGGDMIAGQKTTLSDENVEAMWDAFDDHVGRPLREAEIPFGFTIGNHDGSASGAHERDRRLARAHWKNDAHDPLLGFIDRNDFPFSYTFAVGDLFVLVWDASSADVQDLDWVERALKSDEARRARMRFVIGHLPIYAVAEGRNRRGEVLNNPEELRSLLERQDVAMYISGHHHAYYPGCRGSLELLHAGAIGQGPRPLIGQSEPSPKTVSILDVDPDDGSVREHTYDAESLEPLGLRSLPPTISGINGLVYRDDHRGQQGSRVACGDHQQP